METENEKLEVLFEKTRNLPLAKREAVAEAKASPEFGSGHGQASTGASLPS